VVLSGTAGGLAAGYALGAGVAGLAYCALFVLLAILTRNAVVVGLIYVLIWESLVGSFVPGAQVLSIQQWALAVTEKVLGSSAATLGVSSAVSFVTGVVLLAVVVAGCTWFAGSRLRTLRLTGSE
jgi:ABC-2 type transport system permease protein